MRLSKRKEETTTYFTDENGNDYKVTKKDGSNDLHFAIWSESVAVWESLFDDDLIEELKLAYIRQ